VLLFTDEDDFNALASVELAGSIEGPVYRLGARQPSHGVVAPDTGGERTGTDWSYSARRRRSRDPQVGGPTWVTA
jgi:hypothetical protein